MTTVNPYLNFNGNCAEAMQFYKDCIGGELILRLIKDSPMAAQFPIAMQGKVLHSSLVKDGFVLMASDCIAPGGFIQGNNISLSVNCNSEEELNTLYQKLGEGGKIFEPLKQQFWGAMFGCVDDQYGTRWMLNYHNQ